MIYTNGQMRLLCVDGEGERDALFINVKTTELVKGCNVKWLENGEVTWGWGKYYGLVSNYVDLTPPKEYTKDEEAEEHYCKLHDC